MRVDFYTLRLREFGHLCTNSARAHEGAKAEQKQVFLFESVATMGSPRIRKDSWGDYGVPENACVFGVYYGVPENEGRIFGVYYFSALALTQIIGRTATAL